MKDYVTKGLLDPAYIEYLKSLREFGFPAMQQAVDAIAETRNLEDAAKLLGIKRGEVTRRIHRLKKRATSRGFAPEYDMKQPAPEGFYVKGVSTYYDADGKVKGQWVKTKKSDDDKLAWLMDAIEPLAERVAGKSLVIPAPVANDADLLCIYPMGDPHIGMHAWAEETRDRNFNLKLAERNLLAAVNHLVDLAPPSKTALIINLGDFFHSDGPGNTTTKGTPVDIDGRFHKVLETGVRIMVESIECALRKHEKVVVFNLIGNHDDMMSTVLGVCLKQHFNNNPRVELETRPRKQHYYEFGECLFGMNHGHAATKGMLPALMAAQMSEAWGRTKYRRFYCGHLHHEKVEEFPGCTVEIFRTLAPADAWHAGRYSSGNDMRLDVWHKRWGFVNRHIVGIAKVLAAVGTEDD